MVAQLPGLNRDYWKIDGIPLDTMTWGIESLNGQRGAPMLRKSGVVVPGAPGITTNVAIDSHEPSTITFKGNIRGANSDGTVPGERTLRRQRFDEALTMWLGLFSRIGRLINVEYIDTTGTSWAAKGRVVSNISPDMRTPRYAGVECAVEIVDTYLRGPEQTFVVPAGGADLAVAGGSNQTILDAVYQFSGSNTLSDPHGGWSCQVDAGGSVTIDAGKWTAHGATGGLSGVRSTNVPGYRLMALYPSPDLSSGRFRYRLNTSAETTVTLRGARL